MRLTSRDSAGEWLTASREIPGGLRAHL